MLRVIEMQARSTRSSAIAYTSLLIHLNIMIVLLKILSNIKIEA